MTAEDYRRFRPASDLRPVGEALSDFMRIARFTTRDAIQGARYTSILDNIGREAPQGGVGFLGPQPVWEDEENEEDQLIIQGGGCYRRVRFDEDCEIGEFAVFFGPVVTSNWRGVIRSAAGYRLAESDWREVSATDAEEGRRVSFVLDDPIRVDGGTNFYVGVESDISSNEIRVFENDYPLSVLGSQANEESFTYQYSPLQGWDEEHDVLVYVVDHRVYRRDPASPETLLWTYEMSNTGTRPFVTTEGEVVVSDQDGKVYKIDLEGGDLIWEAQPSGTANAWGLWVNEDGSEIYVGNSSDQVFRLNSDGNEAWEADLGDHPDSVTPGNLYELVGHGDYVYALCTGDYIWQLSREGGSFGWRYDGDSLLSSNYTQTMLAVPGIGLVFFEHLFGQHVLRTIDFESGSVIDDWTIPIDGLRRQLVTSPDGRLLIVTQTMMMMVDVEDFDEEFWRAEILEGSTALNAGTPAFSANGGEFYMGGNSLDRLTRYSAITGEKIWESPSTLSSAFVGAASLASTASHMWELVAEHQMPIRIEREIEFDPLADDGRLLASRYWESVIDLRDIEVPLRGLVPTWLVEHGSRRQVEVEVQDLDLDYRDDPWMTLEESLRNAYIAESGVRVRLVVAPADAIDTVSPLYSNDEEPESFPFPMSISKNKWRIDSAVSNPSPPGVGLHSVHGYGYDSPGLGDSVGSPATLWVEEGIARDRGDMEAILGMNNTNNSNRIRMYFRRVRDARGSGFSIEFYMGGNYHIYVDRHSAGGDNWDRLESYSGYFSSSHPWAYNTGVYRCRMVWDGDTLHLFLNDRHVFAYTDSALTGGLIGDDVGVFDNYSNNSSRVYEFRARGMASGEDPDSYGRALVDHVAAFYDRLPEISSDE